jgi:hypothetical protein
LTPGPAHPHQHCLLPLPLQLLHQAKSPTLQAGAASSPTPRHQLSPKGRALPAVLLLLLPPPPLLLLHAWQTGLRLHLL